MTALLGAEPTTTVAVEPSQGCSPRGVIERELRRAPVRFVDADAELTLRLDAEGQGHHLRVVDLDGEPVMDRLLPTASCEEAAVAAALIIDRALRNIVVRLPGLDGGVRAQRTGVASPLLMPREEAPAGPPATVPPPPTSEPPRPTPESARPTPRRTTNTPSTLPRASPAPTLARESGTPPGPGDTPPRPPGAGPAPTLARESGTPPGPGDTPPIPPRASPAPTLARESVPPPGPAPRTSDTPPIPPRPSPAPSPPPKPLPISEIARGALPSTPRVWSSAPPDAAPPTEQAIVPTGARFELTAGGGFSVPTPATLSLLLTLDGALQLSPRWRVGLLAAFSFGGATPVVDEQGRARGTLSAQTLFALPHAMACLDTTVSLCGGLRAGVRFAAGTAAGPFLFQTRTVFAPAPTLGPAARAAFTLGPVVLALDVTGLVNLTTPALGVEGLPTTLQTPRFELLVQASAGGRTR